MKTLLISDIVNEFKILPPKYLPDHSILRGIFDTSFFNKSFQRVLPISTNSVQANINSSTRPKKKNIKKMPADFFMTDDIRQQVFETINKTRLGLQCQTPALSKVYFTWVGTIILGLKKFLVQKKS